MANIKNIASGRADIIGSSVGPAKASGKKRATRKDFEVEDNENDPMSEAFEAMEARDGIIKNWNSFRCGWEAAMRYNKKRRRVR